MPKASVRLLRAGAALFLATLLAGPAAADGTVNIYTYRQPDLIQPVLDAFTAETGIKTEVLFLDKGLEERVAAEGENSPADVIMTVDIARLTAAKEKGITQPLDDETINKNIPAEYRDPEGDWFGVTKRARVVYASKDRVKEDRITYADLADPKWKGKHLHPLGPARLQSRAVLGGDRPLGRGEDRGMDDAAFKANLARKPDGGDRAQAKCHPCRRVRHRARQHLLCRADAAPTRRTRTRRNGRKRSRSSSRLRADGGTHVNISGMALAKNAPNRDNAVKLMQFLSGHKAQQIYAEKNFEYPVEPGLEPSEIVKSFGALKADTLPLADIAKNRKAASEMVDRVGLDDGPSS